MAISPNPLLFIDAAPFGTLKIETCKLLFVFRQVFRGLQVEMDRERILLVQDVVNTSHLAASAQRKSRFIALIIAGTHWLIEFRCLSILQMVLVI
jgi:hypothetical protein